MVAVKNPGHTGRMPRIGPPSNDKNKILFCSALNILAGIEAFIDRTEFKLRMESNRADLMSRVSLLLAHLRSICEGRDKTQMMMTVFNQSLQTL